MIRDAVLEDHRRLGVRPAPHLLELLHPKGTPPKGRETSALQPPPRGPFEVGVAEGVERRPLDRLDAGVEGLEGRDPLALKASTRLHASPSHGVLTTRRVPERPRRRAATVGSLPVVKTAELTTPALLVDAEGLEANLRTMAQALPGNRLRPHVKAHKCTALAARQAAHGATRFTCATIAEMEGMARAGLAADLLLANEVVDATRLGPSPGPGHG